MKARYPSARRSEERCIVEEGAAHAYLERDPFIPDELEPDVLARISHEIPNPHFFTLDFTDLDLCKAIVVAIADRDDVLVCDDHGNIRRGSKFVEQIRMSPSWDWR